MSSPYVELQQSLAAFQKALAKNAPYLVSGAGALPPPAAVPPQLIALYPTASTKSQTFTVTQVNVSPAMVKTLVQQFFTTRTPNRIATLITPSANLGTWWVGGKTVDKVQYGTPLIAGSSIDYTIDDLSKLYWIADTVNDTLTINWEWGIGVLSV